ncbi:PI-PLC domain-containing protein [Affinirhizobium pseudoryzae]|uniref:hypothetical protein n=1 Tax=Allorhizobium pseudoryzae TaxID=379684 RepID=UPI0013ECD346|nr:hypothetical protein [Allorhizobium pseudoryzae]
MKILAHRGWWLSPAEKNSEVAFRRAFEGGFGVETDVRDQEGILRIAHDVPVGDGLMSFADFLRLHRSYPGAGRIALNIKADGLQKLLRSDLAENPVDDLFCFDMAVPDALGYVRGGFCTYTRQSEVETVPAFLDQAQGVWLDAFYGDWIVPEVVEQHLAAGRRVALVSPELHGRDHRAAWDSWRGLRSDRLEICTDLPDQAANFFN